MVKLAWGESPPTTGGTPLFALTKSTRTYSRHATIFTSLEAKIPHRYTSISPPPKKKTTTVAFSHDASCLSRPLRPIPSSPYQIKLDSSGCIVSSSSTVLTFSSFFIRFSNSSKVSGSAFSYNIDNISNVILQYLLYRVC